MPSHLPAEVRRRIEPIRLLVLDVDGVLTDGTLVYSAHGEEVKHFNVRDGLGIRLLLKAGIQIGVITGRETEAVAVRCRELGMKDELVFQRSRDKGADLDEMQALLELGDHQVCVMGDDLTDLPILGRAGFSACPADAAAEVVAACHYVCRQPGGRGAVRELAELVLKAQRLWLEQVGRWVSPVSEPG